MARVIEFEGRHVEVPDDASDAEIQSILSQSAAAPADFAPPTPPPGEVIHGATRSYISDQPGINVTRPSNNGADPATETALAALKGRGATEGTAAAVARPFLPYSQGTTLGAGDEILSAIFAGERALRGEPFGPAFDYAQEFQRQELAKQREEHPILSAASEIAGAVGTGSQIAKAGLTATKLMPKGILPQMLGGSLEGAGYGATVGFAGADGSVKDRAEVAARNLPVAAVVGAAAPAVAEYGINPAVSFFRNLYVGARNPAQRADEILVQRIMQDRQTPEELAQAVEAAKTDGVRGYRAVDAAGKNTQRAGSMAAKAPGEFRNTVAEDLATRQAGQGDRIAGYVNDALGPGNDFLTEQSILASRRAAADPHYQAAYKAPPPSGPVYDEMLRRQSVQEAMRAAEKTAAERQVPITELFTDVPNPNATTRQVPSGVLGPDGQPVMKTEVVDPTIRVPTMRGWDFIKRELDGKVNQLYASKDTTAAEAVRATRNGLRDQLAADNPDYAAALRQYADDSASLEAIQTGRDLAKARNPDEARATFQGLDQGNQDLARKGFAREVGVKLDSMRTPQDKAQVFDTPVMQDKLDTMIDDPVARLAFETRLARERDMTRAGRALTAGSNTFENFADNGSLPSTGGALGSLFSGHPMRALGLAVGNTLGFLARHGAGMNEDVAKRVGDYLMSADPAVIRSISDLYGQAAAQASRQNIVPAAIDAGVNGARTRKEQR
jgi:hypothetical protein